MGRRINLSGCRFGKLVVTDYAYSIKEDCGATRAVWNCVCDCGNKIQVKSELLRSGKTRSCGCLKHELNPREDLSDKRFGKLTVIQLHKRNINKKLVWECKCDCGNTTYAIGAELKNGHTKSCGCLKIELTSKRNTIHGLSKRKIRYIWKNMIDRCQNTKSVEYHAYGGRGISVCEEWHDLTVFSDWAFRNGYSEMENQSKCTIDRIDVNGDYCPENCRFADMKTQCRNKQYNRLVEHGREIKTLAEWEEISGINRNTISYREKHGLPLFERRNLSATKNKEIMLGKF